MQLKPALPMHLLNADGSDCQPNCPRCAFDRVQAGEAAFMACAARLVNSIRPVYSVQCPCGEVVSLPKISGMPMTFVCFCGREYNQFGDMLPKDASNQ